MRQTELCQRFAPPEAVAVAHHGVLRGHVFCLFMPRSFPSFLLLLMVLTDSDVQAPAICF